MSTMHGNPHAERIDSMIAGGATEVLDRAAARALAAELTEWADMAAEGGDSDE